LHEIFINFIFILVLSLEPVQRQKMLMLDEIWTFIVIIFLLLFSIVRVFGQAIFTVLAHLDSLSEGISRFNIFPNIAQLCHCLIFNTGTQDITRNRTRPGMLDYQTRTGGTTQISGPLVPERLSSTRPSERNLDGHRSQRNKKKRKSKRRRKRVKGGKRMRFSDESTGTGATAA